MARTLRHWKALFLIYLQDGFAYRASGFIWVLTDFATAATMPLVWSAAVGSGAIQGYNRQDFVLYYLCMLLVSCFVTSHFMWEVAMEIKEGQFTTYLIRPISYFQFMLVRNFTWRCVRTTLFLPLFLFLIWAYRGMLSDPHVFITWQFALSVVLGHLVSFVFVMAMAMLALFVQEAQSIFEVYYIPMLFLSGQLFPVAMLPPWAKSIAVLFPFYYTTGAPTEMLIGRIPESGYLQVLGIQSAWLVGLFLVGRLLWRYGLRHYTAVGM